MLRQMVVILSTILMTLPALARPQDDADFADGQDGENFNRNSLSPVGAQMAPPVYGGTGCPQGSVTTALAPDKKTMTLLFDAFIAQAGDGSGRDRRDCRLQIPVTVPAGFQFAVMKLDYRGFVSAPAEAKAKFVTDLSLLGPNAQPISEVVSRKKVFVGPKEKEFFLRAPINGNPQWSSCGGNVTVNIDSRVVAVTNSQNQPTMLSIDSLDTQVEKRRRKMRVNYHIFWRQCR